MGGAHKDRLSVLDASFVNLERDASHMHVGGVMLFEGPPLDCNELMEQMSSRLHLVPRYRQKLAFPRLQAGRPTWIDDECFNLDYHVRHTALPRPGTIKQLRQLASRVFSQRLDRTKPLWETWLVDGLEDDRFALINKTHHALIDGMSGVDLISLLFDATREPRQVDPPDEEWKPQPSPSDVDLIADGIKHRATAPLRIARAAADRVRHPAKAVERARGAVDLLGPPLVSPAPPSPLNVQIGTHRRVHWVAMELEALKGVKNRFGGTVNDVVLTVVTQALRRWLQKRRVSPDGLELRAMVPVSVRADDEKYQLGNKVAAMRGPLPVGVEDPVECLRTVSGAMTGLKESKQALGAEVLADLQEFAPPTLLAQAARINFSTRLFNCIVTNVPGPQFPIYLLGRELDELIPLAFLPKDHALAFAIMSYNGKVDFGLIGDYDKLADIGFVARALEESLADLTERADYSQSADGRAPVRAKVAGG